MKKVYISLLLFFLTFHYLIPCIYYLFNGFVNVYSEVYDQNSFIKSLLLNVIPILISIFIILLLPDKKKPKEPKYYHSTKLFILAGGLAIASFIIFDGYKGALKGEANGTAISYVRLFFDFSTLLLVAFFFQKKKINPYFIICIYVVVLTSLGSRSAIIMIFLLFLMFPMFSNGVNYKKKVLKVLVVLAIIGPILFSIASSIRGYQSTNLGKLIIGRISFLELNTIAIYKSDNDKANMTLFYEKYGMSNQVKQIINNISPYDFFEYDVEPNQYFRSVFMGLPKENVLDRYMSVNLSLPVYYYIKYGFLISCLFTIFLLVFVYILWIKFSNNVYVVVAVLVNLYSLLYFFDWVVIFKSLYSLFLTITFMRIFEFFCVSFYRTINKILYTKVDGLENNSI